MKQKKVRATHVYMISRSTEEMEALRDAEMDEGLRLAYGEMIEGMKADPKRAYWSCNWAIYHKDGTLIGGIGFKGAPGKDGKVEIGYGIDEPYRRHGYGSEAVAALTQWALLQWGVKTVWAQTEPDNAASQALLLKCGFVPDGEGEEGPAFRYAGKDETSWLPIGMCLGMGVGVAIGAALGNVSLGMCFGMSIGLLFGAILQNARGGGEK